MSATTPGPGRPPKGDLNDPKVVDEICDRLSSGEAIRLICQDEHMPSASTVYLRMAQDDNFRNSIDKVRVAQQESEADLCVEIADEAPLDKDAIAKAKLRIWARQWRMAKLAPKKYGQKVEVVAPIANAQSTSEEFADAAAGSDHTVPEAEG